MVLTKTLYDAYMLLQVALTTKITPTTYRQIVIVTISISRFFIADHFHNLPGFIEERHGHNWKAEATFLVTNEDEELACATIFDVWIDQIQCTLLNDQKSLTGRNPTAESLAQWLFKFLEGHGKVVVRTKIQEKANYWASYGRMSVRV